MGVGYAILHDEFEELPKYFWQLISNLGLSLIYFVNR